MRLLLVLPRLKWDVSELLAQTPQSDYVLFEQLRRHPHISEAELMAQLAPLLNIQTIELRHIVPNIPLLAQWLEKLPVPHTVIPLYEDAHTLGVAIANPFDPILETLQSKIGARKMMLYLIQQSELSEFWAKWESDSGLDGIWEYIHDARQLNASDIHFFKGQDGYQVKFRVHGVMRLHQLMGHFEGDRLLNQVKAQAGLDLAMVAGPQDGRLSGNCNGQLVQVRVATLPTVYGEDWVVRLFSQGNDLQTLASLMLPNDVLSAITHTLQRRSGLVLVTGATGSGKTTTLYAMLRHLLTDRHLNIVSLEDPVETVITGVRQSPINPKIGFGFSAGLRAVLRQDPDVILVGEIRDSETARLTIEAAYTGHLVLASVHTTDYDSTIQRMLTFGIDRFLIDNCLLGVFSQQLVPESCQSCGGHGCETCHYLGQIGRKPMVSYRVMAQSNDAMADGLFTTKQCFT